MSRGRFITFEGVEGSGKTTQIELLAPVLLRRGIAVLTTREPGGTAVGERLREVLLDPDCAPTPVAELLILQAARAELVTRVVEPALARGEWVLSDRFSDSSLAYQGSARGIGSPIVETLNALACGATRPDRTLLLDVDVDAALGRARRRASTTARNRRFEDEDVAFHRAVAVAFREIAARFPERVHMVDATGSPDEVHARVLEALAGLTP